MFKVSKAVVTRDAKTIFVKGKSGAPIAYVSLTVVEQAFAAIGLTGVTDTTYNEALVELAQYVKENGF